MYFNHNWFKNKGFWIVNEGLVEASNSKVVYVYGCNLSDVKMKL